MALNASMFSSARGDWCTPPELLALVRELGPIALDPATNRHNPVKALVWVDPKADGLVMDWSVLVGAGAGKGSGDGLIYLNPPYGRGIDKWVAKCVEAARQRAEVIALLPARTDARWWQDHVTTAQAVCFWRGRLRFVGAPSSAPFPSALAYWGGRAPLFANVFKERGWIVPGGAP